MLVICLQQLVLLLLIRMLLIVVFGAKVLLEELNVWIVSVWADAMPDWVGMAVLMVVVVMSMAVVVTPVLMVAVVM